MECASPSASYSLCDPQRCSPSLSRIILPDIDVGIDAAAFFERDSNLAADRARSDHDYVHVCRRFDQPKMDVVSARNTQRLAIAQMWRDHLFVDGGLHLVRDKDHHNISTLHRLGNRNGSDAVLPGSR